MFCAHSPLPSPQDSMEEHCSDLPSGRNLLLSFRQHCYTPGPRPRALRICQPRPDTMVFLGSPQPMTEHSGDENRAIPTQGRTPLLATSTLETRIVLAELYQVWVVSCGLPALLSSLSFLRCWISTSISRFPLLGLHLHLKVSSAQISFLSLSFSQAYPLPKQEKPTVLLIPGTVCFPSSLHPCHILLNLIEILDTVMLQRKFQRASTNTVRCIGGKIVSYFWKMSSPRFGYLNFAVHLLSRVRLFATPWTAGCQASLSFTVFWRLLRLMSIESVMPSNHLILCHPFLLLH